MIGTKLLYCGIATFILSLLVSCSSKELKKSEFAAERYKALSVQKYGEGAEWIPNSTNSAILCVKGSKLTAQVPQRRVAFFVYEIAADSVLFEDAIVNGSVGWKDDQSVIVEIVPGIEKKDDASPPSRSGYIFDLRTGKARDLESINVR